MTENIANFISITNSSANDAQLYLSSTNNDLQQAIALYFAHNNNNNNNSNNIMIDHKRGIKRHSSYDLSNSQTHKSTKYNNNNNNNDNDIRAPLPHQHDQLVPTRISPAYSFGYATRAKRSNIQWDSRPLSNLFRPPIDVIHHHSINEACINGAKNGKWILVNVQNHNEFDSHRLNRDTWSVQSIKRTIRRHYLLVQFDSDSPEGSTFARYYHPRKYPYLAILDPRTKKEMKHHIGFMNPIELEKWLHDFINKHSFDKNKEKNNRKRPINIDITNGDDKKDIKKRKQKKIYDLSYDELYKIAIEESLKESKETVIVDDNDNDDHNFNTYLDVDDDFTFSDDDFPFADSTVSSSRGVKRSRISASSVSNTSTTNNNNNNSNNKSNNNNTNNSNYIDIKDDDDDNDKEGEFLLKYPEPELTDQQNSTRIQIRLPDGTILRRRFRKNDPISALYMYVKYVKSQKVDINTFNNEFVLWTTFPKKALVQKDMSLQQFDILNCALILKQK